MHVSKYMYHVYIFMCAAYLPPFLRIINKNICIEIQKHANENH